MKKILLILILLLVIGCSKKVDESIKYVINDNEKYVVTLNPDSDYHYSISDSFYITKNNENKGSLKFINTSTCNDIIAGENLEIIKKIDNGFIYKEENYHYIDYRDNRVCALINAKELDNLNDILDNITISIVKK